MEPAPAREWHERVANMDYHERTAAECILGAHGHTAELQ